MILKLFPNCSKERTRLGVRSGTSEGSGPLKSGPEGRNRRRSHGSISGGRGWVGENGVSVNQMAVFAESEPH